VSRGAIQLSILILTEDSAKDSHETITALAKKMLDLVVPRCGTHRIEFEPQNALARQAMRGNLWKSKNPRDRQKLVDLRQSIATKLVEGKLVEGETVPGFVLFHVDGDRSWAEQKLSENVALFETFIRIYVEPIVTNALTKRGILGELHARMMRLRRLTPFYSIEAWLYQNTAEARRRCAEACGRHLDRIAAWEADRGLLDELYKPKEHLCFGASHNLGLATTRFPAEDAFRANKSYCAAVMDLLACADLCAALERTRT
jgi:hypothetical protein